MAGEKAPDFEAPRHARRLVTLKIDNRLKQRLYLPTYDMRKHSGCVFAFYVIPTSTFYAAQEST